MHTLIILAIVALSGYLIVLVAKAFKGTHRQVEDPVESNLPPMDEVEPQETCESQLYEEEQVAADPEWPGMRGQGDDDAVNEEEVSHFEDGVASGYSSEPENTRLQSLWQITRTILST